MGDVVSKVVVHEVHRVVVAEDVPQMQDEVVPVRPVDVVSEMPADIVPENEAEVVHEKVEDIVREVHHDVFVEQQDVCVREWPDEYVIGLASPYSDLDREEETSRSAPPLCHLLKLRNLIRSILRPFNATSLGWFVKVR